MGDNKNARTISAADGKLGILLPGMGAVATTFVAGVEVVALDRSRLLRDVTNALADHQVNILSCQTVTGSDRVAKMRFEFEFANPGYLDAVIRTEPAVGDYDQTI